MIKKSLSALIGLYGMMSAHANANCVYEKPLNEPITNFRCIGNHLIERNHDYVYYSVIDDKHNVLFSKINNLNEHGNDSIEMTINGKYGMIDGKGNIIIPFEYDDIGYFEKNSKLMPVKLNNKYGFINQQAKPIIPFIYDHVYSFSDGLALVFQNKENTKDHHRFFIDEQGNKVFDVSAEISSMGIVFSDGLLLVKKDGRIGFLDKQGKLAIRYRDYDHARAFNHGLSLVSKHDKVGAIDRTGKVIIPLKYDRIEYVDDNFLMLILDKNNIITNLKGDVLKNHTALYHTDILDDKNRSLYIAKKDNQTALLNHELKEIIPFNLYADISQLNSKYLRVERLIPESQEDDAPMLDKKSGIVDHQGKVIFKTDYQIHQNYHHGTINEYYILKNEHHVGVVDGDMNVVLPFEFDDINSPDTSFFIVTKSDKMAIYQHDKPITGFDYQKIKFMTPNLWAVQQQGKWALINGQNQLLTKFDYEDIHDLKYGLIPIQKQGKWGMLNEHYQEIITPIYEDIRVFDNGAISVSKSNGDYHKYGLVDKKGSPLTKIEFDDLESFGATTIKASKRIGDKWLYGLLDIAGKEVFPIKYDDITHSNSPTEQLFLDEQKITINKAGEILADKTPTDE